MKNIVSASIIVSTPPNAVWEYISDFTDASHQTIGVLKTNGDSRHRHVSFKNGHEVEEVLLEKIEGKSIKWLQKTTKGFIPIKDVESEIDIEEVTKGTKLTFLFHYNTKMGPLGMIMNMMMVQGKLTSYAKMNLGKIGKTLGSHI